MKSKNAYEFFLEGKKLSSQNEFLKAIMLFEKAANLEPNKGSIREALALSYYNCGFYSSARKNFEKALEIDLSNDFAHYGLGLCLIKEGKISKALGHLKIAFAMKPNNSTYSQAIKKYNQIFEKLHKKPHQQ